MTEIKLINGPNMNLLGTREPDLYGNYTLDKLEQELIEQAQQLGVSLSCYQSNAEAELIDYIHDNAGTAFVIFNPAAFTHTSVALRDALLATNTRFIEIHITNPASREAFRQTSYFSDIAVATIAGFGIDGYSYALQQAYKLTTQTQGS